MNDAGRDRRGYSLIELVFVLILLGVVAFIVVPRLFNRSTYSITAFYDRFTAALDYARSVAVASNCPVEVQITAGGFSLEQPSGTASGTNLCPSGSYTRSVPNPASGDPFTANTPSGATFSAGTGDFCFGSLGQVLADCAQPDGAAGSNRTITLQSGSATLTVTVYASTGYAARS